MVLHSLCRLLFFLILTERLKEAKIVYNALKILSQRNFLSGSTFGFRQSQ